MTDHWDPTRATAWRALLIDHVAATRSPRHRLLATLGLIAIGAAGGAGISTAAFATTQLTTTTTDTATSTGDPDAVDAPPGVVPGAPLVALLGDATAIEVSTSETVPLTDPPAGATDVRVTVTPLTAGSLVWGTDPDGNNASTAWSSGDVGSTNGTTWYDFPLTDPTGTLYLTPGPGTRALATIQYIRQVPTRLGVNDNGDTYGVADNPDGPPDLIAATGTAPDGQRIDGYIRQEDQDAFSPDSTAQPTTPAEALEQQEERDRKYPNGWDIPLYGSDGTTPIGTYQVGG